jgi:CubicO group peptidase (beta-lactamase class C family)
MQSSRLQTGDAQPPSQFWVAKNSEDWSDLDLHIEPAADESNTDMYRLYFAAGNDCGQFDTAYLANSSKYMGTDTGSTTSTWDPTLGMQVLLGVKTAADGTALLNSAPAGTNSILAFGYNSKTGSFSSCIEVTFGRPGDSAGADRRDRLGIFSVNNNYAELDAQSAPLKFHFGAGNRLFWNSLPFSGDWDNDGLDTIGIFDMATQEFLIAAQNDSDEYGGNRLHSIWITDAPAAEATQDKVTLFPGTQYPVAGDWNGDGTDGVGIYNQSTNTFYLRNDLSSGPADYIFALSPENGFPVGGWPVAGDWDGDGYDEVGVFDLSAVYLHSALSDGTLSYSRRAVGQLVAGDFDGDGVDTIANFDAQTNQFSFNHSHDGAGAYEHRRFGHADEHTWRWWPIAGVWQSPGSPVASQGFPWRMQSPSEQNISAARMSKALDRAGTFPDTKVYSVLVVRNDQLVAERYYHGFARHIAANTMSATKSVLSTLLGIGQDRGCVAGIDAPVWTHLPQHTAYFDSYKQGISIKNMMDMRGGLDWTENAQYNATIQLGFEPDAVQYSIERPVADVNSPPGAIWLYSNGLPQMGSGIIAQSCGSTALEYANQHLFSKLGISAPRWDNTAEGNNVGGGGLFLRPRDMARFGQLFLSNGEVEGHQLVSEAWVDAAINPYQVIPGTHITYGLWWWGYDRWRNYPHGDAVFAAGAGGQMIFLFPSWNMLVVTTADWASADNEAAIMHLVRFVDTEILRSVAAHSKRNPFGWRKHKL